MKTISLKIKRQDDPEDLPYWEIFDVEFKAGMTVATALRAVREKPVTADGNPTAPVVWETTCMEGMCGACAMIINGRVGLACHTPVEDLSSPVVLEPLSKFPIVRDLKVDRQRMFDALERSRAWVGIDGVPGGGPAIRVSPEEHEGMKRFASCIMCGACSEACPQVNARSQFAGAFLFSQTLPLLEHPIGRMGRGEKLDALLQRGGISDCAGAEACEAACPKGIPLGESVARLGWIATGHAIRRLFRG
ncbi:MAG: succinate dehydrogenase iron-sulfur subunit [Pseudomonadota bacterium]